MSAHTATALARRHPGSPERHPHAVDVIVVCTCGFARVHTITDNPDADRLIDAYARSCALRHEQGLWPPAEGDSGACGGAEDHHETEGVVA